MRAVTRGLAAMVLGTALLVVLPAEAQSRRLPLALGIVCASVAVLVPGDQWWHLQLPERHSGPYDLPDVHADPTRAAVLVPP